MIRYYLGSLILLISALLAAPLAQASEGHDSCTGVITSLPTVITTPGIWCLNQDLATAMTSGNAIEIQSDDVTVDCNGFKLDGLAAGLSTVSNGIYALDHKHDTIRHCDIHGFKLGVYLQGTNGGDNLVEDNYLYGTTWIGLQVQGDGSVVRRNRIINTGGSTLQQYGYGISTYKTVDILDNVVSGVAARVGTNGHAYGIYAIEDKNGRINGNSIHGLVKDGTGTTHGISAESGSYRVVLRDNYLVGDLSAGSLGMFCNGNGSMKDNIVSGFETSTNSCIDNGGNAFRP